MKFGLLKASFGKRKGKSNDACRRVVNELTCKLNDSSFGRKCRSDLF